MLRAACCNLNARCLPAASPSTASPSTALPSPPWQDVFALFEGHNLESFLNATLEGIIATSDAVSFSVESKSGRGGCGGGSGGSGGSGGGAISGSGGSGDDGGWGDGLVLEVHCARGLLDTQAIGDQDPYVKALFGGQTQRTLSAPSGGTDPAWDLSMNR